jgi:NADH:ubiquinone oxidoreductase subunit 6 (subunit J)
MARRIGFGSVRYRDWKRSGLASLLFVLSIFCLWVSFNGLFMLPGKYDVTIVTMVIGAIAVAFGFAIASGKQFIAASTRSNDRSRRLWSTPPVIFWCVVVLVFGGMLLLKGR